MIKVNKANFMLHWGVLSKRCSENMQQIYKRCNFIKITLWHGCSPVNLPRIFRTAFTNNTTGRMRLTLLSENVTFTTSFYHKPTLVKLTYKFGNVYTLAYRCFRICSSWTKLYTELVRLKQNLLWKFYRQIF